MIYLNATCYTSWIDNTCVVVYIHLTQTSFARALYQEVQKAAQTCFEHVVDKVYQVFYFHCMMISEFSTSDDK
jgi:hypothetical protein